MKRVTEDFLEQCAILDLEGSTASVIDEHWEPLMYHEQMAQASAASYAKTLADRPGSHQAAQWRESMYEQKERAARLHAAQGRFRDEWERRGGWERVYLVLNHDGHYHRSTSCSTTYPTTAFGWVPTLSDHTEDQIIAEVGCMACTVCWPAAPRHPKFIAMEEQRAAEQQAKADGLCPGSGQYGEDLQMQYVSPRGKCPSCHRTVSVTKTGKVRQHKTREQERIDEQAKDAAKITGDAKAFNRLHTLALKANDRIDLLNLENPGQAISRAWYNDIITGQVRDVLNDLLKQRERRAAKAAR